MDDMAFNVSRMLETRIERAENNGNNALIVTLDALKGIIALLKEREPLEPELEGGGSNWWYVCGECHGAIDERDAYCRHCGRAVKKIK